ncbi:hypothetical protein [Caulobacter sp. Root342]|uniref:hypothetical protein n=1 Tax=Caulobacter sp. Root342 TaxID=1736519 RepID=UPI0006F26B3B|nr:hypothetical protein [Caulobacter sp. Root342]KQV55844.1 hypothetical protein ASC62_18150 [Caulobacter sp. Root342]
MRFEERQAWIDLWEAVFGEPPPIEADADLTARILVDHLPAAPPYELGPVRPETDEPAAKLKSRTG